MIIGSMIGFGSLARDSDMTLSMAIISTVGIWGLPGQMAMAEMSALGAPMAAIVIASSMANLRFMPMALSVVPLFRADPRGWAWRYVLTQVMSINVWAVFMLRLPSLPNERRFPFFVGLATSCLTAGIAGTVTGYILTGVLPTYVSVSLIFLNLCYFTFVISSSDQRNCIFAVLIGAVIGPIVYNISPNWGLPFCGLAAGTAAYYLDRALGGGRDRG